MPSQDANNKKPGLLDRMAYWFATGAGAGLLPVAPGTFGAIEGVGIFLAVAALARGRAYWVFYVVLNIVVLVVGVMSSGRAARMLNQKDPRRVVIDEVSGQMIALGPILLAPKPVAVLSGFLLFRVLDIFKPYPIKKVEHLPGGFGIMADDVLAGLLAAVIVWVGRAADVI